MALLKNGSSGNDVVELQKALNNYLSSINSTPLLKEDGDFGTGTEKAVNKFKTSAGLTADGIVDDQTLAKLHALNPVAVTPVAAPVASADFSQADMDKFATVTAMVIDNLEGGYYHPDMNSPTGKLKKHYDYLDSSGETMFGIDRLNGIGDLGKNPAWNKFWGMLDAAGANPNWGYNYTGGPDKDVLTKLAIEIMAPQFNKLRQMYLQTNLNYVMQNNRLIFHFAYATWNGSGWFKKFASDIDKAVLAGKTSPDELAQVAIDSRTKEGLKPGSPPNSLLVQTGEKIKVIFEKLK